MSLSKDSTIGEIFKFIENDEQDVQVLPVTLSKPGDDVARLMIIIQGAPNTANHIMANLMTAVQDMHDLAAQQEADKATKIIESDDEEPADDVQLEIVS